MLGNSYTDLIPKQEHIYPSNFLFPSSYQQIIGQSPPNKSKYWFNIDSTCSTVNMGKCGYVMAIVF